ncbi:MAG: hypothetical protein HC924_13555 [Synechococcaceae cyanobacterium SM2_3_2]|nr:hypothetical protein [Synechococcaceae cyanobacterium SM2_3_2]
MKESHFNFTTLFSCSLTLALPFLLQSCMLIEQNREQDLAGQIQTLSSVQGCPDTPGRLTREHTQDIDFSNSPLILNAVASGNTSLGYRFYSNSEHRLDYQTLNDLCIWLISPHMEIMTTNIISRAGDYILQLQAPRGVQTFELSLELVDLNQPTPTPPTPLPPQTTPSSELISDTSSTDPLDIFQTYFRLIQQGDTTTAWNYLSPGFQDFWINFGRYQQYWDGFSTISVRSPRIIDGKGNGIWLEADMEFIRPSGNALQQVDNRLYMVWDEDSQSWEFIPSPRQFIMYYFRNINARNYRYTWSRLDPRFFERRTDYEEYIGWWESVDSVALENTDLLSYEFDEAVIRANLNIIGTDGSTSRESLTYRIQFFPEEKDWRFIPL